MEHNCSYCGAGITPNQEKTTIALFSKAVCSKNECTKKAQDEANKQTETLMVPRAKILAFLARKGFEEQKGKPGFFILEGATKIAIDLNNQVAFPGIPVIGVLQTNGDIIEEGHGIQRIDDLRQEIEGILKSKGVGKNKKEIPTPTSSSQSTEQEKQKQPAGAHEEPPSSTTEKTKLGTPDTLPSQSTELVRGAHIFENNDIKTRPVNPGTPDTLTKEVKDENRQSTERQDKNIINATKPGDQKIEVKGGQESPQPKGKATIKTCSVCGLELSGARALECFQKDKQFICEGCEDINKLNIVNDAQEGRNKQGEPMTESNNLPATKKKQELVIGTCEAVATQYGIPVELANLFFMKMNDGLYIKNPGLLYLAGKKGYSRIEVTTSYDEKTQEWSAECKIYPKLTKDILEGISKLDKDLQKIAFDFATQPTNGTGRASKASVKMATMHPFLKEMAQTRAQNRCLRAFTSYGGTSLEELPEAQIERD